MWNGWNMSSLPHLLKISRWIFFVSLFPHHLLFMVTMETFHLSRKIRLSCSLLSNITSKWYVRKRKFLVKVDIFKLIFTWHKFRDVNRVLVYLGRKGEEPSRARFVNSRDTDIAAYPLIRAVLTEIILYGGGPSGAVGCRIEWFAYREERYFRLIFKCIRYFNPFFSRLL